MGKFKVGDRVRFVECYGLASKGDEAVITGYSDVGNVCLDVRGHPHTCYERRIELANDDSPVRTVTRREIETGRYGKLELFDDYSAEMTDWSDAEACRAAARIFNEIADVLDEQSAEVKKEAA